MKRLDRSAPGGSTRRNASLVNGLLQPISTQRNVGCAVGGQLTLEEHNIPHFYSGNIQQAVF